MGTLQTKTIQALLMPVFFFVFTQTAEGFLAARVSRARPSTGCFAANPAIGTTCDDGSIYIGRDSANRKLVTPPTVRMRTDAAYYWSSTEYSTTHAWVQKFNDGAQFYGGNKDNNVSGNIVRCIRRHP